MTEREYIDAKELGTVTAAINVLKDIVPANSAAVSEREYANVMSSLYIIQEKLFKQAKINK